MTANKIKVQSIKPPLATLILIGIVLLGGLIVFFWAIGLGVITDIFAYLNLLQENPPMWVEAPVVMSRFLLLPSIIIFVAVFIITKISPQPKVWSRFITIAILLILTVRYIQWRSLSTLNLSNPLDGTFSIALFLLEIFVLFNSSLQLFLMVKVKDNQRERDRLAVAVTEKTFQPRVDIFIPTYDEPEFILRRTVIGCQAIDYEAKTVYLLDDTRRSAIAELAAELGCEYITRPNNNHAKAGNINHALPLSTGEFIAFFDADFIPSTNFLARTLGLFQDRKLALLQTPQNFYNIDPIARNLGLEDILTPEEEVFYRQLQPIKDAAGSVICAGTSFVMRREALESIGGFVTDSLSEDYFTGIRLSSQGYRLAYIDEKLSAGLAAENIADHAKQRLRWARGTLQAFFINSNPLTISGLNFMQRLAHLEGLLHWFSSIASVFFLLMPLGYAFFDIIPIRATTDDFLFFFLPYYITKLTVFSWLNYRSRSAILSNIYGLVLAFPQAITVIQVMLAPFANGFDVTPKGTKSDRFSFNWKLAFPLLIVFILTAISLWSNIYACIISAMHESPAINEKMQGLNLGWIWSTYNLLSLGGALLILLDVPKPDLYEWFNLRRVIKLETIASDSQIETYWGVTTSISQIGAHISLTHRGINQLLQGESIPVSISILEENINISGRIVATNIDQDFHHLRVNFDALSLEQERKLVTLLFCRPGQWKRKNSPGELYSIWLMLRILLRPKVLFDRTPKINAIEVGQRSA
ncbi:glycosyltransferase [Waterburya agarophytonicola K14]|uniref:Glycosyltransferase n=1 Tax=Waterburya agarophytonicola KI4 TaxID=2874699 RepID=A0A964FF99_9CYAN|nr:glycosyltransferase [Waterburya agarophytonicola]MCC0175589.1 glycosyltransferase [Waterburya agarophytonicola KI4]